MPLKNPSTVQQILESCGALLLLIILSPLLLVISVVILAESGRPVLFPQRRLGHNAKPFRLLKFRTMRQGTSGPSVTANGDPRTTRTGRLLRKYKLDELPQLWNVFRDGMSIVGPRPEVPEFVDLSKSWWRSVMTVRPGITSPASIAYRHEELLLGNAANPIQYYTDVVLPSKLAIDIAYLEKRSFLSDLQVILLTARCALFPNQFHVPDHQILHSKDLKHERAALHSIQPARDR